jgi:hypothetical protein
MRILGLLASGWLAAAPAAQERDVEKLLRAAEEAYRAEPDPSDPGAAAERLGRDRARIVAFVRDEIGFEPYEGVLRDAGGTLLARAGNELDRALLLRAMLKAAGEKVRLVRAAIGEEDAARLRDAFLARKPAPARGGRDLARLAGALGADPKALEAGLREDDALAAGALQAAGPAAAALREAVGPRVARPIALPREHVWLQVSDPKTGAWEDVDPAPVAVRRGDPLPVSDQDLAARRRSVRFGLVLHRRVDGKPESVPLLSVPFDLAAVAWQPVHFSLLPAAGPARGADAKARADALRAARIFRAGLRVEGRMHGAAPFDLEGKTYSVGKGGELGAVRDLARGVGGLLEGLGEKKAPGVRMERLVLEVALREPGAPERVLGRTLLAAPREGDRLRALGVLRASFLVDGAPLPAGERHRRELGAVVRNAAGLRSALAGKRGHVDPELEASSLLLRFADLRRRLLGRAGEEARFTQLRPGIIAETRQLWLDEATSEVRVRRGIDLFENPAVFVAPGGEPAPHRATLLGAADTALEHLLLAGTTAGDAGGSAWTLLEKARGTGAKPLVEDRDGGLRVRWNDEAWWSVDPATGGCVGRVASGAGQAVIEHAWNAANEVCSYSGFFDLYSKSPAGSKRSRDVAGLLDNACDVLQGQWPVEVLKDKILELNEQLWKSVTEALAGMGA